MDLERQKRTAIETIKAAQLAQERGDLAQWQGKLASDQARGGGSDAAGQERLALKAPAGERCEMVWFLHPTHPPAQILHLL